MMFWKLGKIDQEEKYIMLPMLYPMGAVTFAVACSHCKNIGSDKCDRCKRERVSGFELKQAMRKSDKMDRLEMLVDRLREVARDMDSPRRRTLEQAADYLENQRSEIVALYKILEMYEPSKENEHGE